MNVVNYISIPCTHFSLIITCAVLQYYNSTVYNITCIPGQGPRANDLSLGYTFFLSVLFSFTTIYNHSYSTLLLARLLFITGKRTPVTEILGYYIFIIRLDNVAHYYIWIKIYTQPFTIKPLKWELKRCISGGKYLPFKNNFNVTCKNVFIVRGYINII